MAELTLKYNITFTLDVGVALNFTQLCDITDSTEYRCMLSIEANGDCYEQGNLIIKISNWNSNKILTKEDLIKIRKDLFPGINSHIECKSEFMGGDLNFEGTL